ncbi:MAG TPA: ABC transporter ATP-binding protein, partial [Ornithinimicrobium sp.]|uniref:ABC transporter ATP-binding protein n=1 Tax=Ornithinimicrobium sp. TaxID=1977084 RepID=UPI002B480FEA
MALRAPHRPVRAPHGQEAPALSIEGLHAGYHGTEVLGGVDLEVGRGEWLAVIGPNGAGKSTLLRAVAGLVAHTGRVTVTTGGSAAAREISLVPQSPVLPEGMTAAEYVLIGRTAHLGWLARESGADRRIAAQVLARLGLHRLAGRPVTDLSGGEAQRVVLARALAQQGSVMLLDEPTTALDLGHQVEV